MNQLSPLLRGSQGEPVSLRSVHVQARLQGLLLSLQSRQTYRNDTGSNLETVYTFPMGWGATLLGLHVEIAGKRLQGTVLEKKEATEQYEQAIDSGDTPVMVHKSAAGLYTANLGNLMPGETAVIELEYAQLLSLEQGHIRLTIPTTIAPRYGQEHAQGGLAAHETARASALVAYPFTLSLALSGPAAKGRLRCPSHPVDIQAAGDRVTVTLEPGAWLDRDFVLNIDALADASFAVAATHDHQHAAIASFCPQLPAQEIPQEIPPLNLKILVDCSGSMAGDSMAQARWALGEVFQLLGPTDRVSYTRFGSTVQHLVPKLTPCTQRFVRGALAKALQRTAADLGGTEINQALASTFAIKHSGEKHDAPGADSAVLLITDGDVWDVQATIALAKASGHRLFAIGVGSAPAESLLRQLAEETGGACELVTPNESMVQAMVRMVLRMHASRTVDLSVDWGLTPLWQSPLGQQLYDGQTLHVCAQFAQPLVDAPTLTWVSGEHSGSTRAVLSDSASASTIVRMAGSQQIAQTHSKQEALALAIQYQLVTDQTNLILVHVRSEGNKAVGLPSLEQIEQMQAAGWGGFGSARGSRIEFGVMGSPAAWRGRSSASALVASKGGEANYEVPAFLRKQVQTEQEVVQRYAYDASFDIRMAPSEVTPQRLLRSLSNAHAAKNFDDALAQVLAENIPADIKRLVASLTKQLGDQATAWAMFLDWIMGQLSNPMSGHNPVHRQSQRLVRWQLLRIDTKDLLLGQQKLAAALAHLSSDSWGEVKLPLALRIGKAFKTLAA